jgi:hypothetical protein
MKVHWGVWSCATGNVNRMEGGKALHVHDQGGLGKCKVGAPHSPKRLGADKAN